MGAGLPLSMCVPKNLADLVRISAARFGVGSRTAHAILPLDYVDQALKGDVLSSYLTELEDARAQGLRNNKHVAAGEPLEGKCPARPSSMSLETETDGEGESDGDEEGDGDLDSEDEPLEKTAAGCMIDETELRVIKPGKLGTGIRISMRRADYVRAFANRGRAITDQKIETRADLIQRKWTERRGKAKTALRDSGRVVKEWISLVDTGVALAAFHAKVIAQALCLLDYEMVPIPPQPHQEDFQYDATYHSTFLGALDGWWSDYEGLVKSFRPGIPDARQMAKPMLLLENSMELYEMLLKRGVEQRVDWLLPRYSPLPEDYHLPPEDASVLFDFLPLKMREKTATSKRRVDAVNDGDDTGRKPPRKVTGAKTPSR